MKLRAVALSIALTAFVPMTSFAQTAEDQAAARGLFEEGMRLYNAGDYVEACPKFESSLKRYSGIGTRGKLAECYEKEGKTASAWALWTEVASFSRKNNEPDREAYAAEHAKNLEPMLTHLTVKVIPANKPSGLVVKQNGQVVDDAVFGLAIAVDPGTVTLEASAPTKKTWTQSVQVAAQASMTIEVPALEDAPAPLTPPPTEPATSSNWQRPVGMIGVGVGVAALVTGGIFGLVAANKWSSAFSEGCSHDNNVCTTQQGYDDSHSASSSATLANVFVIGGVVVAGAGAVLWLTAPKHASSEAPAAATLGVSPIPLLGGAAISFHGSM